MAVIAAIMVVGVVETVDRWDWLRGVESAPEAGEQATSESPADSPSETIRNVSLAIGALIALVIAIWRGIVANQQARAAHRQAATAQADLLNKRYQESAEMLGSAVLPVRLAGIYALRQLAEEHPQKYHRQVMRVLCAFVRHPAETRVFGMAEVRDDVQSSVEAITICHEKQLGTDVACGLDLRGAELPGVFLAAAHLSSPAGRGRSGYADIVTLPLIEIARDLSVALTSANLRGADLAHAELRGTRLDYATLAGAILNGADFTAARLDNADLSGAMFGCEGEDPAIGLTQAQLDSAVTDATHPPRLYGMVDPHTGEPLRPPERWLDVKPHSKRDEDSDD